MIQSYSMISPERLASHARLEQLISRGPVAVTFRDPTAYAHQLGYGNQENLVRAIAGKDVCDLGSGCGGLYKMLTLEGLNTSRITSVDPLIGSRSFIASDKFQTERRLVEYPKDVVRKIRREYLSKVVKAFAHKLPFADNSFDLVFDNWAVSVYTATEELAFEDSVLEMIRILRPGGELRIGDPFSYGSSYVSNKEKILKKLGLKYEVIWAEENGVKEKQGVVVYK